MHDYLKEGDELLQENLTLVFEELQKIGWCVANEWINYNELSFSTESPRGNLPALYITRPSMEGARVGIGPTGYMRAITEGFNLTSFGMFEGNWQGSLEKFSSLVSRINL